jgi:hypothetical protein
VRRYQSLVTFQEATESRTRAGQVTYTYENVEDLEDLPAQIVPVTTEERGERMVVTEDLWTIIVQGDRPITTDMAALTTEGVFDVLRVAQPTIKRWQTLATLVTAQRVAV